jgi:hypothetical protein
MMIKGWFWTDDGNARDARGLEHRSVDEVRSVPIPPLSLPRPNRRWRGGRMIFVMPVRR